MEKGIQQRGGREQLLCQCVPLLMPHRSQLNLGVRSHNAARGALPLLLKAVASVQRSSCLGDDLR